MSPSEVLGTAIKQTKRGWGVDRIDVTTLKSDPVESPDAEAAGYMSDGLGNVRLMSITDRRNSGMLTGDRSSYLYRTPGSRDWKSLFIVKQITDPEVEPLAIDASTDSLYALEEAQRPLRALRDQARRKHGRRRWSPRTRRSTSTVSSGSATARRSSATPMPTRKRETGLFRSRVQGPRRSLSKALPKSPADRLRRREQRRNQAADLRRQRHRSRALLSVRPQQEDARAD